MNKNKLLKTVGIIILIILSIIVIYKVSSVVTSTLNINNKFSPTMLTVNKNGELYIVDNFNRVEKFSSQGKFIEEIYSKGKNGKHFGSIAGIKLDEQENLYVLEIDYSKELQIFSADGKHLRTVTLNKNLKESSFYKKVYEFFGINNIPTGFHLPFTISDNSLFIAEINNWSSVKAGNMSTNHIVISEYSLTGDFQNRTNIEINRDGLYSINDIIVSKNKNIILKEDEQINIFQSDGKFLKNIRKKDGYFPYIISSINEDQILIMFQNWSLNTTKFDIYNSNGQFIKNIQVDKYDVFHKEAAPQIIYTKEFNKISNDCFDIKLFNNKIYIANFEKGILSGQVK